MVGKPIEIFVRKLSRTANLHSDSEEIGIPTTVGVI